MSKVEQRSRTTARTYAGRAGVGLALAATTAVGVTIPADQAAAAPAQPHTALHGPTVGATAPTVGATALAPRPVTDVPVMTYRVQTGDTVSHIALRTGSSVTAIVRANNLDTRALIRVGQMLKVPSGASTAQTPTAAPAAPRATSSTHTVRAGDTVSALAKQYGTTVSAIVQANKLRSAGLIFVGQQLTVGATSAAPVTSTPAPAPTAPAPSSASTHTVRPGDTVSALAKQYGTTVSAIVQANKLSSAGLIFVGQRLTVGGAGAAAPAAPAPAAPAAAPVVASGNHTVQAGDTVSALAKKWGTSVAAVVAANKLGSSGLIYVGQRLTVPGAATATPVPSGQLVPDTFLGRTYPQATVASANANKATLLNMGVPSRAQMQSTVVRVAREMGVDPALAQAHAYQESGFNHASVSPANAIGTMQVIPTSGDWASDLVGRKLNLLDPYDNVVAGVAIIRQLQRTSANLENGIAGYYQGAGSVKRYGFFSDTESYVAAVKAHMKRF